MQLRLVRLSDSRWSCSRRCWRRSSWPTSGGCRSGLTEFLALRVTVKNLVMLALFIVAWRVLVPCHWPVRLASHQETGLGNRTRGAHLRPGQHGRARLPGGERHRRVQPRGRAVLLDRQQRRDARASQPDRARWFPPRKPVGPAMPSSWAAARGASAWHASSGPPAVGEYNVVGFVDSADQRPSNGAAGATPRFPGTGRKHSDAAARSTKY